MARRAGSCCSLSVSELMGFVHFGVAGISNFDSLGRLKSWEGRMNVSQAYIFFLWHCDSTRVMASSFLRFLDHTRRTTVGRTPLDE